MGLVKRLGDWWSSRSSPNPLAKGSASAGHGIPAIIWLTMPLPTGLITCANTENSYFVVVKHAGQSWYLAIHGEQSTHKAFSARVHFMAEDAPHQILHDDTVPLHDIEHSRLIGLLVTIEQP